jgi:hypothetical protein
LAGALALAGCTQPVGPMPPAKGKPAPAAGHAHGLGPNGGVVFDLGKYHAEFTVDHAKKECTVLVINGDDNSAQPLAVEAKELTLTTKETKTKDGTLVPPMTITLRPVDPAGGKAARFVGSDPGLANVADFEGTVTAEIDGKPSQGEFKE